MARQISGYLHCDDTSARHRGRNAVCTHIGNELFASFHSTDSKSRLNFLQLLCLPEERYTWCEEAVNCLAWRRRQAPTTAGVEGWNPTDTSYAVADAAPGPYREMGWLAEAGCVEVSLGFESGSWPVLRMNEQAV